MMKCEAKWLADWLARLSADDLSPILNIGASTRHFREVEQPYIDRQVFAPLRARGIPVVHSDLKQADGVDVVGDIFDEADFARLKAVKARAVICTHMFEHVLDRDDLARRLMMLLSGGGLFFVTVPSSYHEHNDPIDTMYRPTPAELASLFPGQTILEQTELVGETYWMHIRKRPFTLFFRHFFRFFVPFLGMRAWRRSMRKLYWLVNHYKVAGVVGRVASSD